MKKQSIHSKVFLLIGLFLLTTNVFSQDPNFYIYLCFGQSNMEGQGTIETQDKTVDSRFKVMQAVSCSNLGRTKGIWYTAVPPLTRCWSGLSPADYFGRTMVANLPTNIRVGVVNVSVAGCKIELFDKDNYQTYVSTITEDWLKNIINEYKGNPYAYLLEVAKLAQKDGVIKGILLHQGESNTGEIQWPAKVKKIYDNLITDLELDPTQVPLLAGEVVNADQGGICASMNSIIATLPKSLPNSFVISSKGCTDGADNLHFNSAGYREIGTRYANKMLSLMGITPTFIGCAYSNGQAAGFSTYWNQVTPENGGKWGSVEGTRDVMKWTDMDAAYNTAKNYGLPFKEHTLIWGSQQPAWMAALDTASQRREIEQWFSLLAARYPALDYIDVVNEPLHNAPNGMLPWGSTTKNIDYANALGGAGKTGWDWIITSFRMARKYFPQSKLIMNEYGVINSATETQKYIQIIKLLQADSLIDGIGEQAHAFTTYGTAASTLKSNLDALGATGVPIYLTEVDIDGSTDLIQLKEMQRVFPVFWNHPSVKGITFWGFRVGMWRTEQGANLVTQTGAERPALKWLRDYVKGTVTITQSIALSTSEGTATITKLGATLNMVATVLPINTTVPNVTWTVTPSTLATIDSKGLLTALAVGTVKVIATAWDGSGIKGSMDIVISNLTSNSTEKAIADEIKVYPNPAINGCFTINGIEAVKQIELVNLVGEKVIAFNNLNQSSINIQVNVPTGIYVLNFFDGEQYWYKKIIIE